MPVPLIAPAQAGQQGHRQAVQALVVMALIGNGAVMCARADDRPFLRTTHAMAGDDEEGWEVSTTLVSNRRGSTLSLQLEHDLSPTQRLEVEWGGASRASAPEPERGLRLRSLWLSPRQAGWGLATKLGLEPAADVGESGTRAQALAVASWPLAGERVWLHANLGWQWQRGPDGLRERRSVHSLAAHWVLATRQWLFVESARSNNGLERFNHLGLRHWLQPHALALDLGWGRQHASSHPGDFVSLNLSFFDLNF